MSNFLSINTLAFPELHKFVDRSKVISDIVGCTWQLQQERMGLREIGIVITNNRGYPIGQIFAYLKGRSLTHVISVQGQ